MSQAPAPTTPTEVTDEMIQDLYQIAHGESHAVALRVVFEAGAQPSALVQAANKNALPEYVAVLLKKIAEDNKRRAEAQAKAEADAKAKAEAAKEKVA